MSRLSLPRDLIIPNICSIFKRERRLLRGQFSGHFPDHFSALRCILFLKGDRTYSTGFTEVYRRSSGSYNPRKRICPVHSGQKAESPHNIFPASGRFVSCAGNRALYGKDAAHHPGADGLRADGTRHRFSFQEQNGKVRPPAALLSLELRGRDDRLSAVRDSVRRGKSRQYCDD